MSLLNKIFKKKEEKSSVNKADGDKMSKVNVGEDNEQKKNNQEKQVPNVKAKKGSISYRILVKPLVTEKTAISAKEGKYIFEVSQESNKIMVKNAFRDFYGIMPQDVNIIKLQGKKTGTLKRIRGRRKNWKKAIVTLKAGESINIYGGAK